MKSTITELDTAFGSNLRALRTDNGLGFISKNIKDELALNGNNHQLSGPYSPESIGETELLNRNMLEMERTIMLRVAHVPQKEML